MYVNQRETFHHSSYYLKTKEEFFFYIDFKSYVGLRGNDSNQWVLKYEPDFLTLLALLLLNILLTVNSGANILGCDVIVQVSEMKGL